MGWVFESCARNNTYLIPTRVSEDGIVPVWLDMKTDTKQNFQVCIINTFYIIGTRQSKIQPKQYTYFVYFNIIINEFSKEFHKLDQQMIRAFKSVHLSLLVGCHDDIALAKKICHSPKWVLLPSSSSSASTRRRDACVICSNAHPFIMKP